MIQAYLFTEEPTNEEINRLRSLFLTLQERFPHELSIVDISSKAYLREKLVGQLPLVEIGSLQSHGKIDQPELDALFLENQARVDSQHSKKEAAELRFSTWEKLSLWFSRHYLLFINLILCIYVALPFAAPTLMKLGQSQAAAPIYKAYNLTCHQLAYRSFFLFGEQAVYPLGEAGLAGVMTYTQATGLPADDIAAAQAFLGNKELGYKVALCQRDVAIYLALLAFGLVFLLSKRRLRPLSWIAWFVLGLVPIGLDGGTQLLGQIFTFLPDWLLMRESTPILRVLTGTLFGWMTAWFGYPSLEELQQFTRERLEKKAAILASKAERQL